MLINIWIVFFFNPLHLKAEQEESNSIKNQCWGNRNMNFQENIYFFIELNFQTKNKFFSIHLMYFFESLK